MTSRFRTSLCFAAALTGTARAHAAYGQDVAPAGTPGTAEAATSALTPPKLVTFVDATYPAAARDRKSTRLNSSHPSKSRMPSSA